MVSIREIAQFLHDEYSELGFNVTTRHTDDVSNMDPMSQLLHKKKYSYSNELTYRTLGFQSTISVGDSLKALVDSLIAQGIVDPNGENVNLIINKYL